MRSCLLLLAGLLYWQSNLAATISGIAQLDNSSDHSGIRIDFIAKSQSAISLTVFNLTTGIYSASVTAGVYDIKYSKSGYQEYILTDQFLNSDLSLNTVILSSKPVVHVNGNIQGFWSNANVYQIDSDITVPTGQELIIEKGTRIEFTGFYRLLVFGKITALGELNNQIVFTSNKVTKNRGDWAGIFTYTTTDSSRFIYCIAEYASSKTEEKAIFYNAGSLRLSHVTIRGSGYGGVYNVNGGRVKLDNSEITNCYFYGFASTQSAMDAVVVNNKIHHIDLIGVSCQWSVSKFYGNTVNNTGYTGIQAYGDILYERNICYNNPYGIFVVSGKPIIRNNTLYKNVNGIGFYDSDFWKPSAIISSNIIHENTGWAIYSEGIYSPEKVEYNLISSNVNGITNRGPVGLGIIVTKNNTGLNSDTYLNIFDDPSFFSTNETNSNYLFLNLLSPAIDSGDPQFSDPDNSISDCGAVPFQKYFQNITFGELDPVTFGDVPFDLTATASSNLAVSYTSSNTNVATISGNTVTFLSAGTTIITAYQSGNTTFNAAQNIEQTLTVNKANQTISFTALTNKTFGDAPFSLPETASSNLTISYSSSNTDVATVTGNTVTLVGAGTATIKASQSGNTNFNTASDVEQQLTVDKANQTISFTALTNKTFGDAPFSLSATASSNLIITYSSSNTNVATITGNTVTLVGAGTATIKASQSGNTNFNAALDVEQQLTVDKANQTISFTALTNKTFGDAPFSLLATASSNLSITYSSSNTGVATISDNTVTLVGAGTATITASQSGNTNFNAALDVAQLLTVNKAGQDITFSVLPDKTMGDASFILSATATSALEVTFSTTSANVNLTGNQVTLVNAGRVAITASQSGNTNYNAAAEVDRSFCIRPGKPTLTVSNANSESPILTSSAVSGNQWFLNGAAIPGATNATLNVTQPGIYKVHVSVDDCISDFSSEQSMIITGDVSLNSIIDIFPNPATERITILLGEANNKKVVSLYQAHGVLMDLQETFGKEANFELHSYAAGLYIVKIKIGETIQVMRFVKQ